jgi:LEA14-like dessication related protein
MKNKWIYILAGITGLAVLGYVIVRGWLNKLDYGIDVAKIKILHIGFDNVQMKLPVWIYNPSPFNIIIKSFHLNLYINGQYLAKVNSDNTYMIKGKASSQYPLIINIPSASLISILKDYGAVIDEPNWQKRVNISVDGTISLESGIVTANKIKLKFDDTLKNWMG